MDINCDLGEWETPEQTAALMRLITSANIACAGHAGDEQTMRRCVELAQTLGVKIGAHPGATDRETRGRALVTLSESEFLDLLGGQVSKLQTLANGGLQHVKLHGGLYHWSETPEHAAWFVSAMQREFPKLRIVALAGGIVEATARAAGFPVWGELFADRGYRADGSLIPRGEPGAVVGDLEELRRRMRGLLERGEMRLPNGGSIPLRGETLCIHSDSPEALEIARVVAELFH